MRGTQITMGLRPVGATLVRQVTKKGRDKGNGPFRRVYEGTVPFVAPFFLYLKSSSESKEFSFLYSFHIHITANLLAFQACKMNKVKG